MQQEKRADNWAGEWITSTQHILTIDRNNMIVKAYDIFAKQFVDLGAATYQVHGDGDTVMGKLMHCRRGDEDLMKWAGK